MDIAGGIAAAKATIDLVKSLRELEYGLSTAELKANMAELYSNLAEVKMALVDAQEELVKREKEIEDLSDKFKDFNKLVEHQGYKYKASPEGKPVGIAFCPACLAEDGTQIHPVKLLGVNFRCPRCRADYNSLPRFK